jgi:hypothetical protein
MLISLADPMLPLTFEAQAPAVDTITVTLAYGHDPSDSQCTHYNISVLDYGEPTLIPCNATQWTSSTLGSNEEYTIQLNVVSQYNELERTSGNQETKAWTCEALMALLYSHPL